MEKVMQVSHDAFRLYARNMHTETYTESGSLVKVHDRVVEVLDGEVELGTFNCVYICSDKDFRIDVSSDVKEFSKTEIVENANNTSGCSEDSHGYLAKVRIIDKTTYYIGCSNDSSDSSVVTIVECI